MKTNTNITYKEFKETNIYKSAVIIEFINANGQSSFNDISDEALGSMIIKDYNYSNGCLEIILREEENKMKNLEIKLYNAIVLIAENENYKLDDSDFIESICQGIGMSEEEYRKLMLEV